VNIEQQTVTAEQYWKLSGSKQTETFENIMWLVQLPNLDGVYSPKYSYGPFLTMADAVRWVPDNMKQRDNSKFKLFPFQLAEPAVVGVVLRSLQKHYADKI